MPLQTTTTSAREAIVATLLEGPVFKPPQIPQRDDVVPDDFRHGSTTNPRRFRVLGTVGNSHLDGAAF